VGLWLLIRVPNQRDKSLKRLAAIVILDKLDLAGKVLDTKRQVVSCV
jgi:hypothetical protein